MIIHSGRKITRSRLSGPALSVTPAIQFDEGHPSLEPNLTPRYEHIDSTIMRLAETVTNLCLSHPGLAYLMPLQNPNGHKAQRKRPEIFGFCRYSPESK